MKRTSFLLCLMCCAASVMAQDVTTPEDEAKKRSINQIKLSEMAVYSDVVQMATDENEAISLAQQKSLQMMQTHVVEVCAKRLHMDKKDVQEIWDVIDDKCQNIVVKKGDLFRVFTYIMKDALHVGPRKAKQEDIDEYLGPEARAEVAAEEAAKAEAKAAAAQPVAVDAETETAITEALQAEEEDKSQVDAAAYLAANTAPVVAAPVVTTPAVTATPVATTTTALSSDPAEAQRAAIAAVEAMNAQKAAEEARLAAEAAAKAEAEAKAKAEAEAIAKAAEAARLEAEAAAKAKANMPALCKTMIEKQNLANLMRFLNEEKNKQTLMYGSINTMQYQDRCYIVILDRTSKEIVALLDKGTDERTDFVSGKKTSLVNYKRGNYSAVLVQEY